MTRNDNSRNEVDVNKKIGSLLRLRLQDRYIVAERAVFRKVSDGNENLLRPDILVARSHGSSVVIESEFHPARNVEEEALGRLGKIIESDGTEIDCVIALVLPDDLRKEDECVEDVTFQFCVLTNDRKGCWESGGWNSLVTLIKNLTPDCFS